MPLIEIPRRCEALRGKRSLRGNGEARGEGMHELVLVSGPDKGRVFRLEEGQTLVIGRGQASDTQINDPSMSRVHCRAMVDNGAVRLVDAGSSTGVIVNGSKG